MVTSPLLHLIQKSAQRVLRFQSNKLSHLIAIQPLSGTLERIATPPETKLRHREPRSGVAIQYTVHWIASEAYASSQ